MCAARTRRLSGCAPGHVWPLCGISPYSAHAVGGPKFALLTWVSRGMIMHMHMNRRNLRIRLTQATTLFLVVGILVCPVACSGGISGSVRGCCGMDGLNARGADSCVEQSPFSVCCAACVGKADRANDPTTALPADAPSAPHPGQSERTVSGCLCSGAVPVKKATHQPSVERSLDLVSVALPISAATPVDRSTWGLAYASGERATPGRSLRALHMLLLC